MWKTVHTYIDKMTTKSEGDENSSSIGQIEISFATSNKGKQILIHENYLFECNKTTASKKYWKCSERDCGVYIHTSTTDELICATGVHHHPPDPDQLSAKLLLDKMKERILREKKQNFVSTSFRLFDVFLFLIFFDVFLFRRFPARPSSSPALSPSGCQSEATSLLYHLAEPDFQFLYFLVGDD
jgi:FLYWCH zinc finger domain